MLTRDSFNDFDEYVDLIGQVDMRLMMQKRRYSLWNLDQLEFSGIHFQKGVEGSGITSEGQIHASGTMFFVPLGDPAIQSANGIRLDANSIVVAAPNSEFCLSANDSSAWCTLFIPNERLPDLDNSELRSKCRVIQESTSSGKQFLDIVRRFVRTLETDEQLAREESALEIVGTELTRTASRILQDYTQLDSAKDTRGRPRYSREEVRSLLKKLVGDAARLPKNIQELSVSAGVSERTLRNIFKEMYELSPAQYLKLIQLHSIRRALKEDHQKERTISRILADHGVWEFGRFSKRYRKLFGENPSETHEK